MTDTKWINETASRYGKGGDPSIHAMMKVAIEAERERCAKIADDMQKSMHEECDFGAGMVAEAIRAQSGHG